MLMILLLKDTPHMTVNTFADASAPVLLLYHYQWLYHNLGRDLD